MNDTDCTIKDDNSDATVVFTQDEFENWGYYTTDGDEYDIFRFLATQNLEELAEELRDSDCIETADKMDILLTWNGEYDMA